MWRTTSKWGAIMMPQQLLWYALLPLACIGCVIGLRRDVLMTSVLVGIVASGAAAFAINNGNVGTMVRFRDWIVPFVVWLSALGGSWALVRLMPTSALWAAPDATATSGERAAFAGGNQIVSH